MARLVVLFWLVLAAQASAAPYYVIVSSERTRTAPPDTRLRVSPPLPAGASLQGTARCRRVHTPGAPNETVSVDSGLDAGVYQYATSSCTGNVQLVGTTGELKLYGGQLQVIKSPTYVRASAAMDTDPGNPLVVFAAEVVDAVSDGFQIPGAQVVFRYQRGDGFWELTACTAVTTNTFDASAECTLTGNAAQRFITGTGEWEAHFAGNRNYHGSGAGGHIEGTGTDRAAAERHLQNLVNDPATSVTIVPNYLPPRCHNYHDDTSVSLIGVSIGQLDCKQMQVLQILSGVSLAIATGAGQSVTMLTGQAIQKILVLHQTLTPEIAKRITVSAAMKLLSPL